MGIEIWLLLLGNVSKVKGGQANSRCRAKGQELHSCFAALSSLGYGYLETSAPLGGCPRPALCADLGKLLSFNCRFLDQLPVQLKQPCWIHLCFLKVRILSFYIIWMTKYQKEKTKVLKKIWWLNTNEVYVLFIELYIHRTAEHGWGSVQDFSGFSQVYIVSDFALSIFTILLAVAGLIQPCTVLHFLKTTGPDICLIQLTRCGTAWYSLFKLPTVPTLLMHCADTLWWPPLCHSMIP